VTELQPDVNAHSGHVRDEPAEGGHIHSHKATGPLSPPSRRFGVTVLIAAAAVTAVSMALLWPNGSGASGEASTQGYERRSGEVLSVDPAPCPGLPPEVADSAGRLGRVCGSVTLRLADGKEAGQAVEADIPTGPGAPEVAPGDEVVIMYIPDTFAGSPYQILDHQRGRQMWLLVLAAALAVIAFGRWRGLAALAGLAVTFTILLVFVVPAILDGRPALGVAVVGSAAIMLLVLYMTHGFSVATSVAVLGTLASLTLTGLLAAATTVALHLTGVASEEASFVTLTYQNVNMQGLLLAGILIGSLGVLDDVAVTQAVTVSELAAANPAMGWAQLYRAGARVGRSHIASVVNTIVLAYAGASLPLLILLAGAQAPLGQLLTGQMLAEEIVRSVVGSMGLLAAVPITTALAALTAHRAVAQSSTHHPRTPPRTATDRSLDPWLDSDEDGWLGQHALGRRRPELET
jgi:uncharacterized membrane protein